MLSIYVAIFLSFIGQFDHPEERGRGKEGGILLFYPATSFTLLENMEIYCKIQVTINLFF